MNIDKKRINNDKNNSYHDVAGIVLIIVSAFFLICLVTPLLSDIGVFIKRVTTGVLGYVSYPLFLCMLLYGILLLMHKKAGISKRQFVFIILIAVFALLILHTALDASRMNEGLGSYLSTLISLKPDSPTAGKSVGGVIFGLFAFAIKAMISFVGAYILYSLLLVLFSTLLIFDIKNSLKASVNKKKTPQPFVKGMSEPQPVHDVYDPTLFVGTIEPHRQPASESGDFSSMYSPVLDSMPRYDSAPNVQNTASDYDNSESGNRSDAWKALMGDSGEMMKAYENELKANMQIGETRSGRSNFLVDEPKYKTDFLPYNAVSSPSVKPKPPVSKFPDVPVPPEKDIKIYEGPILNGEMFGRASASPKESQKTEREEAPKVKPLGEERAPIVNGDNFGKSGSSYNKSQSTLVYDSSIFGYRRVTKEADVAADAVNTEPVAATKPEDTKIYNGDYFTYSQTPEQVEEEPVGRTEYDLDNRPDIVNGDSFSDSYKAWSKAVKERNNTLYYVDKPEFIKYSAKPVDEPVKPERPEVKAEKPIEPEQPEVKAEKPIEPERSEVKAEKPVVPERPEVKAEKPVEPERPEVRAGKPVEPERPEGKAEKPVEPEPFEVKAEKPVEPEQPEIKAEKPVEPEPFEVRAEKPVEPEQSEVKAEKPVEPELSEVKENPIEIEEIELNLDIDEEKSTQKDIEPEQNIEPEQPEIEQNIIEPEAEINAEPEVKLEPETEAEESFEPEAKSEPEEPEVRESMIEPEAKSEEEPIEPTEEEVAASESDLNVEPKSYFEGEIEAAKADEDLYLDENQPDESYGAKVNGNIPDSLKLDDEELDLSEKREEVNDDNTGYYTQEQTFEKHVGELSIKLRDEVGENNKQINMDDYKVDIPTPPKPKKKKHLRYTPPPIDMLVNSSTTPEYENHEAEANALEEVLHNLKIEAKVINIIQGPAVTRYELEIPLGQSVKRIPGCADDIAYSLAATGKIRIEAPIKGKRAVGVEVPNKSIATVSLREIIDSKEFGEAKSCLTLALGKDITGTIMTCNLEKMPHLLIAGTTGSGKSICLNTIIISLLYKATPDDVRIILIDPKQVEFVLYRDMPHLLMKNIINDCQQAINAFKWAREEMDRRYSLFSKYAVRNLSDFNECEAVKTGLEQKLPRIVIIVDELGELMIAKNSKELELNIMSMAQKARAAGMHLILATQRPSVDVLTGTIKANLPSRIAFAVKSSTDSRTILDQVGAETLLGMGDMLYSPLNANEPTRVQGAFISTEEIESIVKFVRENNDVDYDEAAESIIMKKQDSVTDKEGDDKESEPTEDPLMKDILRRVIETGQVSTSMIQRRFSIGYNKAARIIDQMEEKGYIGPLEGSKSREVYITAEMFKNIYGENS